MTTVQALAFAKSKEVATALGELCGQCGLTSYWARSYSVAQEVLDRHPVVLVCMDWEGGATDISYRQMLSTLHRTCPQVVVAVVDVAVREHQALRAIHTVHPSVLTHDPALGDVHLASRIGGILGRTVGDLVIRNGVVVHQPSGEVLNHPIATQLLAASPHMVRLERRSAAMAVLRIREWLRERNSCVVIETFHGTGEYRAVVKQTMAGAEAQSFDATRLAS